MSSDMSMIISDAEKTLPLEDAPLEGSTQYKDQPFLVNECPRLNLTHTDNGKEFAFDMGILAKEPFRILTESERRMQANRRDAQETAVLAKKKQSTDSFSDRVDPRKQVKVCIIGPTSSPRLDTKMDTKMANEYAAYVLNALANHANHWYEYITRFVNEMYGPGQRAFWKRMEDGWLRLLSEERATENKLAWNAFFAIAGAHEDDLPGGVGPVEPNRDRTVHVNKQMSKLLTEFNNIGQPNVETNPCTPYDLTQCIQQKIELCRMMQGYCKGYGTSELEQEVIRYVLEDMGRNMTDDMCLVDKNTNQPDMNRVVFQVPHFPTVDMVEDVDKKAAKSVTHVMYDSAEANSEIDSAPGACRTIKTKQVASYAVSAGYWTGKLNQTIEAATGTGADAHSMSWGMGHCANVALKITHTAASDSYYKLPAHRTKNGQIELSTTQKRNLVFVEPGRRTAAPAVKPTPANAMEQYKFGKSTVYADNPTFTPGSIHHGVEVTKPLPQEGNTSNTLGVPQDVKSAAPDLGLLTDMGGNVSFSEFVFNLVNAPPYVAARKETPPGHIDTTQGRPQIPTKSFVAMAEDGRKRVTSPNSQKELNDREELYKTLYVTKACFFAPGGDVSGYDAILNPVKTYIMSDPHVFVCQHCFDRGVTTPTDDDAEVLYTMFTTAFRQMFPNAQMSSYVTKATIVEFYSNLYRALGYLGTVSHRQDLLVLQELRQFLYYQPASQATFQTMVDIEQSQPIIDDIDRLMSRLTADFDLRAYSNANGGALVHGQASSNMVKALTLLSRNVININQRKVLLAMRTLVGFLMNALDMTDEYAYWRTTLIQKTSSDFRTVEGSTTQNAIEAALTQFFQHIYESAEALRTKLGAALAAQNRMDAIVTQLTHYHSFITGTAPMVNGTVAELDAQWPSYSPRRRLIRLAYIHFIKAAHGPLVGNGTPGNKWHLLFQNLPAHAGQQNFRGENEPLEIHQLTAPTTVALLVNTDVTFTTYANADEVTFNFTAAKKPGLWEDGRKPTRYLAQNDGTTAMPNANKLYYLLWTSDPYKTDDSSVHFIVPNTRKYTEYTALKTDMTNNGSTHTKVPSELSLPPDSKQIYKTMNDPPKRLANAWHADQTAGGDKVYGLPRTGAMRSDRYDIGKNWGQQYVMRGTEPTFGAVMRAGDPHLLQDWWRVMKIMGLFGVVFDNLHGAGASANASKHDPFDMVGPQLPIFRCFIPSYKNIDSSPLISHVRSDLQELKRLIELIHKETVYATARDAFWNTMNDINATPANEINERLRNYDHANTNPAMHKIRELAREHCQQPGNIYARAWLGKGDVSVPTPPLTFTSKFLHTVMNPEATRDLARSIFSDVQFFPELNSSIMAVNMFTTMPLYELFMNNANEIAIAFAQFDSEVFYSKQFTKVEDASLRFHTKAFDEPPQGHPACPRPSQTLGGKTFDMCNVCGILPYRLLTMPYLTLARMQQGLGPLAEDQLTNGLTLDKMDADSFRELQKTSTVVNVLNNRATDLKKLHSMRSLSPVHKLVLIKGVLAACYGADVAAMMCEATLMRDPVMGKIAVATGEELPFVAARAMVYQPHLAGMLEPDAKLGDTDLKVCVEHSRVYLRDGSRFLTEEEASDAVVSEILRQIRDNVITFTDPKTTTQEARMRLAEKYLMLNAEAMRTNMTMAVKKNMMEWNSQQDHVRVHCFDSPELLIMMRLSAKEAAEKCLEFMDLALPYAATFEAFGKMRDPASEKELHRILTKASFLPECTAKHIPDGRPAQTIARVPGRFAERTNERTMIPTWNPSMLGFSRQWSEVVEEFATWASDVVHKRGCAQTPVTVLNHMDLLSQTRLRGAPAAQEPEEPLFGATEEGRCPTPGETLQVDGSLFGSFEADATIKCPMNSNAATSKQLELEDECRPIEQHELISFPVGERVPSFDAEQIRKCTLNSQDRPQFFAVCDAAGLLWERRAFHNPAHARLATGKSGEPLPVSANGSLEDMHYHARRLAETMAVARREFHERCKNDLSQSYETSVKLHPEVHLPVSMLGQMLDESFRKLYPLQPVRGTLRKKLERVHTLPLMYATMNSYSKHTIAGPGNNASVTKGATEEPVWCPVSHHHYYQLLRAARLFDNERQIPINPWTSMGSKPWTFSGYVHSNHSCIQVDGLQPEQYEDYAKNYLRYQIPREKGESPHYPFARYGGTPVAADFIGAPVYKPGIGQEQRSNFLRQARFGHTMPLDLGQLPFEEHGLLQDAFSYEYRQSLKLSPHQAEAVRSQKTDCVLISNFRAYTRNLTLLALASRSAQNTSDYGDCDRGLIVRHLMRMYTGVSSYISDDGVEPAVVIGYAPVSRTHRLNPNSDRPLMAYACSVGTLKKMIELTSLGAGPTKIPGFDSTMRTVLARSVNEVAMLIVRESDRERFLKSVDKGYREMKQLHPGLTEMEYMRKMMQTYRRERNVMASQLLGDAMMASDVINRRQAMETARSILIRDVPTNHLEQPGEIDHVIRNGARVGMAHAGVSDESEDPMAWATRPTYETLCDELFASNSGNADVQHVDNLLKHHRTTMSGADKLKHILGNMAAFAKMRANVIGDGTEPLATAPYSVPVPASTYAYQGAAAAAAAESPSSVQSSPFRGGDTEVSSTLGQSPEELNAAVGRILHTVESKFSSQRRFQGTSSFLTRSQILDTMNVPDFLAREARRRLDEDQ